MYLILWTGMGFVNGFLLKADPKLLFHHFHQNFIRTFIQNAHKKRSLISETSLYHHTALAQGVCYICYI